MGAFSSVDICNRALQLVGAGAITSLTDGTHEAAECGRCYDIVRQAELRSNSWNFSIKRAVLAPLTGVPLFDYSYAFELPTDCLRVLLVNDPYLDWSVEGRTILTNAAQSPWGFVSGTVDGIPLVNPSISGQSAALNLRYISDVTDTTQFDSLFVEGLAAKIGTAICQALTQSNQKLEVLSQIYAETMKTAKRMDAFESLPEDPPEDAFINVRW